MASEVVFHPITRRWLAMAIVAAVGVAVFTAWFLGSAVTSTTIETCNLILTSGASQVPCTPDGTTVSYRELNPGAGFFVGLVAFVAMVVGRRYRMRNVGRG